MPTSSSSRHVRVGTLAVAAAVSLIVAACTGGDDGSAATTTLAPTTTTIVPRNDDGVLRIGMFLPTTGSGAPLGQPMIDAVEAAIDEINAAGGVLGEPVVSQVLDESADTGFESLLAEEVDAIVGPASSLIALSQLGATVQSGSGVVTCSPSATALSLDNFPDDGLFFRTVPSDSLQMAAISKRVAQTGASSVAIGFLDDPYGRGLVGAFVDEVGNRREIVAQVGFGGDEEDLSGQAAELLAAGPRVIVILGDADDGSRLLTALDQATGEASSVPQIIVNDAIRNARQTIQGLSSRFRDRITAIAPLARSITEDGPEGFFAAHARDCVNLIALAAERAGSDSPSRIKVFMVANSRDGRVCTSFDDCVELLSDNLEIDYNGASGSVDLAQTTGDPIRAKFEATGFDEDGNDAIGTGLVFDVP